MFLPRADFLLDARLSFCHQLLLWLLGRRPFPPCGQGHEHGARTWKNCKQQTQKRTNTEHFSNHWNKRKQRSNTKSHWLKLNICRRILRVESRLAEHGAQESAQWILGGPDSAVGGAAAAGRLLRESSCWRQCLHSNLSDVEKETFKKKILDFQTGAAEDSASADKALDDLKPSNSGASQCLEEVSELPAGEALDSDSGGTLKLDKDQQNLEGKGMYMPIQYD